MVNNQEGTGNTQEPGWNNQFTSQWYNPATELSPAHMAHMQRGHERILEEEAQNYRNGAGERKHLARMAAEAAEPITNKFRYCRLGNNLHRKIKVSVERITDALPPITRFEDHVGH